MNQLKTPFGELFWDDFGNRVQLLTSMEQTIESIKNSNSKICLWDYFQINTIQLLNPMEQDIEWIQNFLLLKGL